MTRLELTNDSATITRVSSRTRAGDDKVPLVAVTIEIPEEQLEEAEIGRLFRARGRTLTLHITDPQLEMALVGDDVNGRGRGTTP